MALKVGILIEFQRRWPNAFARHAAALASEAEMIRQAESLVRHLPDVGRPTPAAARCAPVPLFSPEAVFGARGRVGFGAFAAGDAAPDVAAESVVVACEVDPGRLDALRRRVQRVRIWPDSPLTPYRWRGLAAGGPDGRGGGSGGPDCPPFRPASTVDAVRELLDVAPLWRRGFRGGGVVVGLLGEGVHRGTYPVADASGGAARTPPGGAPATGHGSTLAAGVLIAAPDAALYDYPFWDTPTSGGALGLLQAVLGRRRLDGTPHLTCHGYGLATVPPRETSPDHEAWNPDHPLHRKLREVVASGAACLFGAGDSDAPPCPSPRSEPGGVAVLGRSIHGPNGLAEVITVAAVNGRGERIGCSARGPGLFDGRKPDVSAYTHVLGHFGPGRPGGARVVAPFDGGSAAAAAVATGVGALLLGAFPGAVTPGLLKEALTRGAIPPAGAAAGGAGAAGGAAGWNPDTGHGVVNAGAAYDWLRAALASS